MTFRRALGPFDATMVVIGGIIGSGIFIHPYIVAQRLATPALVLAAWAAGGAIALAGAYSYAELGALFPRAGGQYVYLRDAYHPVAGFLYGWALLALIESGFSNRAVSRASAVGMWQFMSGTGKAYGLRIDAWLDERRDPVKATAATASASLLFFIDSPFSGLVRRSVMPPGRGNASDGSTRRATFVDHRALRAQRPRTIVPQ